MRHDSIVNPQANVHCESISFENTILIAHIILAIVKIGKKNLVESVRTNSISP